MNDDWLSRMTPREQVMWGLLRSLCHDVAVNGGHGALDHLEHAERALSELDEVTYCTICKKPTCVCPDANE